MTVKASWTPGVVEHGKWYTGTVTKGRTTIGCGHLHSRHDLAEACAARAAVKAAAGTLAHTAPGNPARLTPAEQALVEAQGAVEDAEAAYRAATRARAVLLRKVTTDPDLARRVTAYRAAKILGVTANAVRAAITKLDGE